jgi:glycerophosphoryl diester phosphodiesterase
VSDRSVLIIAHRGASGYRPEHTLEAYALAVDQGADYIEPDLVMSRDGVLVARHENEIGATTDVAQKFPERRTTKVIDGVATTGWFVEDFTLAELRTLRARERVATRSHAYDGQFGVPTFEEVLELARRKEGERGRPVGVYPETKHPSYHRSLGLSLEDALLEALARWGYTGRDDPVFIQSFEEWNLRLLRRRTTMRLVRLLDARSDPSPAALATIAEYADGIGPEKSLVQPLGPAGELLEPTGLIAAAHALGLLVHPWTFRADAPYLQAAYAGDAAAELRRFASLGADGVFTDFPDVAVRALRQ